MNEWKQDSELKLNKILFEIFSKPIDLFDFFFENEFSFFQLISLTTFLSLLAPLSKLINNFILLKFFPELSPTRITEGVFSSLILFVFLFAFLLFFEKFSESFLKKIGKPYKPFFVLISFLPTFSSSVFWILPKPFPALGFLLGFFVGIVNYYEGLKYLYELNIKQISSLFFAFFILLGSLSFLILFGLNVYRNF